MEPYQRVRFAVFLIAGTCLALPLAAASADQAVNWPGRIAFVGADTDRTQDQDRVFVLTYAGTPKEVGKQEHGEGAKPEIVDLACSPDGRKIAIQRVTPIEAPAGVRTGVQK